MPTTPTSPQYDFFTYYEYAWDARDLSNDTLPVLDLPFIPEERRDSGYCSTSPITNGRSFTLAPKFYRRSLGEATRVRQRMEPLMEHPLESRISMIDGRNVRYTPHCTHVIERSFPSTASTSSRTLVKAPATQCSLSAKPSSCTADSAWTLVDASTLVNPCTISNSTLYNEVDPRDEASLGVLGLKTVDSWTLANRRCGKKRSKMGKARRMLKKWCYF